MSASAPTTCSRLHAHKFRISHAHDPVEVDTGVGSPKLAPEPDDGRIVGTLDTVENPRHRSAAEVVLRIAMDQRPDVVQQLGIRCVVQLEKKEKGGNPDVWLGKLN